MSILSFLAFAFIAQLCADDDRVRKKTAEKESVSCAKTETKNIKK